MRSIPGKNTRPELVVRRELHNAGFRYRIHYQKLKGKPDIVLPKYKAVILVNGCFWHGHNCHIFKEPRQEKWREKIVSALKSAPVFSS
jgi:DNA mismatch endonuclease (patch repair protein)